MKFNLKRLAGFAPIVKQVLQLTPLAPVADDVAIGMVEAAGLDGASNEQKLTHVRNIAVLSADAKNKAAGKPVVDVDAVAAAADGAISETYQVMKLLHNSGTIAHPEPPAASPTEPAK